MDDTATELETYLDDLEKQIEDEEYITDNNHEKRIEDDDGVVEELEDNQAEEDEEEEEGVESDDHDKEAPNINDDDFLDDAELETGTIFMDAEGNYYYQSGKKAVQVKPVTKAKPLAKSVAAVVKRKRKTTSSPQGATKHNKLDTSNISTKSTPAKKTPSTKADTSPKTTTPKQKSQTSLERFLKPKTPNSTSPHKTRVASKSVDSSIQIKPDPDEKPIVETKTRRGRPKANITTSTINESAITTSSINESGITEVNGEEVYSFNETERTNDDPDYTVDEKDAEVGARKAIVKASALTPDASGEYRCTTCDYSSNKKFLLSRHLKTHSEERPYKCSVCERGFKTNVSLMNHINTHLGNKPHKCEDCDMAFTTSGELTRHRRYRHTLIKPHKCTECDYSSVEFSKLRRHFRCHTGERPYQCPHCTYASPDTFKLKRHMRTHTGEKPYECDICHARFTQSNSLKYHRLIHSVNDKPVFQCHLCPTTCGRKNDLRLHIQKLHNTEKPFPCKRCGKELPDRYTYKMHVKTHEGEKCYKCSYCPYASISQRHLDTHMLIHTDSKPFVCELCEQSFRQKQLLSRHMKVYHTDNYERPKPLKKAHVCPHCERSFAFKGNLIRHMEVHDPNSTVNEEKLRIKLGRMTRVNADGTVVNFNNRPSLVYNDYELGEGEDVLQNHEGAVDYEDEEENDENIQYIYEEIEDEEVEAEHDGQEIEYYEEVEEKPQVPVVKIENYAAHKQSRHTPESHIFTSFKTVSVKKEADCTEFIDLQGEDGADYMVIELVQDGEEQEGEVQMIEEQVIEEQIVEESVVKERKPVVKAKNETITALKDCFGFDDDAEADEDEDLNSENQEYA
ncbi:transcriptional repressor CTCF [Stomoxys calcitrans]|uniref:C2H2-type domain-containing protein n=1 Tax=Stomoxys calcitrans TaxID=35570 RepID=A0A1I8P9K3_STOCA|nr:transcriptional repressor CTCF [Stomoxys calcitrans]